MVGRHRGQESKDVAHNYTYGLLPSLDGMPSLSFIPQRRGNSKITIGVVGRLLVDQYPNFGYGGNAISAENFLTGVVLLSQSIIEVV